MTWYEHGPLQAFRYKFLRYASLYVVYYAVCVAHGLQVEIIEAGVAYAAYYGIVGPSCYRLFVCRHFDAVFRHDFFPVYIRVIDCDVGGVSAQIAIDVGHFGVPRVGTVLLECEAEEQY